MVQKIWIPSHCVDKPPTQWHDNVTRNELLVLLLQQQVLPPPGKVASSSTLSSVYPTTVSDSLDTPLSSHITSRSKLNLRPAPS